MKKIIFFLIGFFAVTGLISSISHASCVTQADADAAAARSVSAIAEASASRDSAREARAASASDDSGRVRSDESRTTER